MTPPKTPAERAAERIGKEGYLKPLAQISTDDHLTLVAKIITAEYASIEQENQKLREALSVIEEASRGTMLTQIHKVAQQALATDKRDHLLGY